MCLGAATKNGHRFLNSEMKKKRLFRDLAKRGPCRASCEQKRLVAERHGLQVVRGKIPVPDIRIEYEARDGERAGVDLELATSHHRGRNLAEKVRAADCEVNVVPLMNKDSLEMTDADRVLILGMVRAILKENAPIVITHGTDTMVETGLYLRRALPELKLPVVLTGAMIPLGFEGSDGLQNLTESLLAVQLVRAAFTLL